MARSRFKISGNQLIPLFDTFTWFQIAALPEGNTLVNTRISFSLSTLTQITPTTPYNEWFPWMNAMGAVGVTMVITDGTPEPPTVGPYSEEGYDFLLRDGFSFASDAVLQNPQNTNPPNIWVSTRSITDLPYVSKGMRLVPPGMQGYVYLGFESAGYARVDGINVAGLAMYDLIILSP